MTDIKKYINPTFLLRGIDPIQIAIDYANGLFSNITIPKKKIVTNAKIIQVNTYYGKTKEEEIFEYKDKSNNLHKIGTTNHGKYLTVKHLIANNISIINIDYPLEGPCIWCRGELDPDTLPLGIPLKMEKVDNLLVVHMDGNYCDFECCYAGLRQLKGYIHIYKDPLYSDSSTLLRLLFDLIYPGQPLLMAPDWRILKSNGGWLSKTEYKSNTHKYVRLPTIITLPAKIEYSIL